MEKPKANGNYWANQPEPEEAYQAKRSEECEGLGYWQDKSEKNDPSDEYPVAETSRVSVEFQHVFDRQSDLHPEIAWMSPTVKPIFHQSSEDSANFCEISEVTLKNKSNVAEDTLYALSEVSMKKLQCNIAWHVTKDKIPIRD